MTRPIVRSLTLALGLAALAALAPPSRALDGPPVADGQPVLHTTYVGTVLHFGEGARRTGSTTLRLRVDELTPDSEATRLTALLRLRGERMLENELAGRDLGFLQIGDRFPERLAAAFVSETASGSHLVLITERALSTREIWSNARSADYRFRVVEVDLDPSGRGGGAMLAAARFRIEKDGTLGARNLGILPWRVLNLRAQPS